MVRSRANFLSDLERLYKLGFRPVTVSEYAENRMTIPPGSSPVVITFDDSHPSQFRLTKDGVPDPNTFVGAWLGWAKNRPDFPVKATFYCNANGPFGPEREGRRKIAMLQSWGSEIAAHTRNHVNLAKVSPEKGRKEVAESVLYLENRGARVTAFATPYGVWPKDRSWLDKGFRWNGRLIKFSSVAAAGSGPGHSPVSRHFRPMALPRIQAYPGTKGIDDWLKRLGQKRYRVYVQP